MVQRITIAPQGPEFSRFVMGYWRLMDWNMSARQLVSFIEEHLDLGVTTVDHADIYGGYQCEAAFGEAMKLAPHLREKMQIVTKCGIATTARAENALGHYITDSAHIIASAEESLKLLKNCTTVAKCVTLVSLISPRHSSHCCNRVCRLRWRPTRLKSLRYISRSCWMAL